MNYWQFIVHKPVSVEQTLEMFLETFSPNSAVVILCSIHAKKYQVGIIFGIAEYPTFTAESERVGKKKKTDGNECVGHSTGSR
jgi:hypothetical protein